MPKNKIHLAIIPDGNRRWAKKKLLKPWEGHQQALDNSRALIEWCRQEPRIATLTLWGFSTENWDRSPEEISQLMRIFEQYLKDERKQITANKTRFIHSGRLDRLPPSLAHLISDIATETKDNNDFTFNLALDYGGRDEIIRTIRKIPAAQHKDIDETTIRAYFDHPELPDIDLVIRTSGEYRTSGFFIWQTAYTEWIFETKLYPEITPHDLEGYIKEYDNRHRRFGR
ncbi:MAG: polyprenyl diphosphate synthase [bacterium]|nr:polyprenyl diphosphate synthase [bacterium]MDZ4347566.1 polyprenyl diphosphate synthase [Candidatus Binatia bacterium]